MATFVGPSRKAENHQIIADQFSVIEIVDGQQRLTTLIILMKAIQKALGNCLLKTTTDCSSYKQITTLIIFSPTTFAMATCPQYLPPLLRIRTSSMPSRSAKSSSLGKDYPIAKVIDEWCDPTDAYDGWTEELRYLFYHYDEHLARKAGHKLNENQWNKIWAVEPSKSVEHIKPQSSGVS